jgi:hypothetical protein
MASYTDKNENKIFLIYVSMEIQKGAVAKSYMTPHISLNICGFPHILGSPSSYMTLQPLPSKFPYIRGKFSFLFYQCGLGEKIKVRAGCGNGRCVGTTEK